MSPNGLNVVAPIMKKIIPRINENGRAGRGLLSLAKTRSVSESPRITAKMTRMTRSHPRRAALVSIIP